MVKLEWGTKRTCQSCTARFYDLRRSPIVCPKCGEAYEVQVPGRRRSRTSTVEEANILPLVDDLLGTDLELPDDLDTDLEDDGLMEDTSDLGEDLDDIDVIDSADESDE